MRYLGMLFVVVATGLVGCTQSIHPLFYEKDLVFDEALLGSWHNESDTWTFERTISTKKQKRPANAYWLTVREGNSVELLQAHYGYIGDHAFLDVFEDQPSDKSLPLHFVFRVEVKSDSLRLGVLGEKWFDALRKVEKDRLRIEALAGQDVSLASTAVLQEMLGKYYRDDPKTLENMGVLVRLP